MRCLKIGTFLQEPSSEGDNKGSAPSEGGNSDNLLQVINYLKREKNLINSQLEALLSENRR